VLGLRSFKTTIKNFFVQDVKYILHKKLKIFWEKNIIFLENAHFKSQHFIVFVPNEEKAILPVN